MSGTGIGDAARRAFRAAVRSESRRPPQAEVEALLAALRARYGSSFVAAIYYGSCRRAEIVEGLVDLHVLVTDEVQALGPIAGVACKVLPPNVYYLEAAHGRDTVRCKYAVIGLDTFRRACTRRAFHSYFWARYAQPVSVVGCVPAVQESIEESLVDALATYFSRVIPAFPAEDDPVDLWVRSLALCYNCELRPEGQGRSRTLVDAHAEYYRETARAALAERSSVLGAQSPRGAASRWRWRAIWGKAVSLGRLLKGLATFDGGLDYAVWKLERHTGRHIDVPDAVRAQPWLRIWPMLFRLWREGVFR